MPAIPGVSKFAMPKSIYGSYVLFMQGLDCFLSTHKEQMT